MSFNWCLGFVRLKNYAAEIIRYIFAEKNYMNKKSVKEPREKKILKKPGSDKESSSGIKGIEQLVEITQLQNKVLQTILQKQDEILKNQ